MSPRELALELLRHRFGTVACADAHCEGLAEFQRLAVPRLERALERYGGALLADSVGLGKTHVGAAVVRRAVARGEQAALVVPTSLGRQWQRALRGVAGVTVATHAQLSRGGRAALERASLVVVDEAHAFRNPRTHRYAALARLTAGRRTLLITATPVNNSLRDLYWLLRLFATDDAFAAIGVSDLAVCVRDAERTGRYAPLTAVLAEVAVRRTRDEVAGSCARAAERPSTLAAARPTVPLQFPGRAPPVAICYPLSAGPHRTLLQCIDALELAPWSALGRPASALLLRLVLLKRLESSRAAFVASLERLLRTLRAFVDALDGGHLLTPTERRVRAAGDADQLAFDALVLEPLPRSLDADALHRAAESDCRRIEFALGQLAGAGPDPKLQRLRKLLDEELHGRPVLVFTEFRDTAHAVWRELYASVPAALIHGGGAWLGTARVSRRVAVERFAPLSNGAPVPPERERPRILIATDVLAEGLNLQDAADLVSFDLPWNPVRLLQRMGRIDRLGSRHPLVRGYYFPPDAELEPMLRLLRRLQSKLAAIRGSIGEDGAVLTGGDSSRDALRRVAPARRSVAADRLFESEERLRALLVAAEGAADPMAGLPLAATAARPPRSGAPVHSGLAPARVLEMPGLSLPGRAQAILFFEYCGRQRAVCLGRRAFEDASGTVSTLELAMSLRHEAGALAEADVSSLVARARAYLLQPPPPARRHPHCRALRQRLLELLGARPGGPTAVECSRVEALAAALRQPLSVGQELALRRIRSTAPFEVLVAEVSAALQQQGRSLEPQVRACRPAPPGQDGAGRPRFLGGFRVPAG